MEFAETPLFSAKKALYLELMLQMVCYLLMFVDKVQVRRTERNEHDSALTLVVGPMPRISGVERVHLNPLA